MISNVEYFSVERKSLVDYSVCMQQLIISQRFLNWITNGGVRNWFIRSDTGGSALYGRSDVGCKDLCRFGSLLHGSNKSFVPTSSIGFKLPAEINK